MDFDLMAIILITVIILKIFSYFKKWKEFIKKYDAFPGPRPRWPLVGNIDVLLRMKGSFRKRYNNLFEEMYLQYKEEGMFLLFFGPRASLYIHKPELVNDLIKDSTIIDKSDEYKFVIPFMGYGLATANGERWRAKRKLLNPTFHSDVLGNFIPIINEEISVMMKLLESKANSDFVDIRKLICNLSLNMITATTMGSSVGMQSDEENKFVFCLDRSGRYTFKRIFNPLLWSDFIFYKTNMGKKYKADIDFLNDFTMNVIETRKEKFLNEVDQIDLKKRKMAFLDLLISLQLKDQSISDCDIIGDVKTMIIAGNETTASSLCWAFLLIGQHEEVQRKIREELHSIFRDDNEREITREDLSKMTYTECALKEAMRIYPPVPLVARKVKKDIEMRDLIIPQGTNVWFNILKLHRNEDVFPNPQEFKPERFLNDDLSKINASFMPFASGPRNCIGQRLAMIEMKLVLAHVLRKYAIVSLDEGHPNEKLFGLSYHPLSEIKIKLKKHSNVD